jgi:outer membrane protein W
MLLAVIAICVTMVSINPTPAWCGRFEFGVKPGSTLQAAHFGADMGKFTLLGGLDYISLRLGAEEKAADEDIFFSISMYLPYLGARYYFDRDRSTGNVVPFIEGGVMFPFATVNFSDDMEFEDVDVNHVSTWGLTGAFGAQYYFSDRFSIGGEYGLRYLKNTADITVTDWDGTHDIDTKVIYRSSYSALSLIFRF